LLLWPLCWNVFCRYGRSPSMPGRIVVAFMMRGRHAGPFASPVGTMAPTHRDIEVRTIDVLTVTEGVISGIWAVSGELGLLRQLGAITLA